MRPGLPVSIALHAAVLGWALVSFASPAPFDAPPASDPIDVELLPPTDVSQQKQGDKTGRPSDQITKDTKASNKESDGKRAGDTKSEEPPPPPPPQKPTPPDQKPQEQAATPPPPPPPPVESKPEPPKPDLTKLAKVEPVPVPPEKPDLPIEGEKAKDIGAGKPPEVKEPPKDQKALEKLLEQAKTPEKPPEQKPEPPKLAEKPPEKPAPKPADKPAPKSDPTRTAALSPSQAKPSQTPSQLRGQVNDIKNLADTGLSASKLQQHASLGNPTGPVTNLKLSQNEMEGLIGALRSQITPCWSPPAGASESGVKVTLGIALNQDGTLQGVEVIAVSGNSNPQANSIVGSAIRAVKMCASQQPFKLPADKYGAWAINHVTFDPKFQ